MNDKPYFLNEKDMSETVYRNVLAKYYAAIRGIDEQVGRMLKVLKVTGFYDDTMIIFTSDHGDYMGYHHMLLKSRRMYEPLMRVPLIIKFPGSKLYDTKNDDRLVSNVDVSATIMDLLGIEPIGFSDGKSLLKEDQRRYITAQNHLSTYMIKDKRYKLIISDIEHHNCFYDLEEDEHEKVNLFYNEAYINEKVKLKNTFYRWLAFEAPAPIHTNEKAYTLANRPKTPPEEKNRMEMNKYIKDNVDYKIFN